MYRARENKMPSGFVVESAHDRNTQSVKKFSALLFKMILISLLLFQFHYIIEMFEEIDN